ncbi:MAG: preprotein translocase subunit SecG [Elusimicrobia bacterium RIFCSPLOWO2_12_FULL_59_9]|nr:MAG: preprotein translocase subunit SecG [Elusimicrobia bacterium RIFCSPLOWO2_12_FULL_59_9]
MYAFATAIHIITCLLLIVVVLMQAGRGAGLAVFGGGESDAFLNAPSSTSFLKQFTGGLAFAFLALSLFLTLLSARLGTQSVVSRVALPPPPAAAEKPSDSTPVAKEPAPSPSKPAAAPQGK